MYNMFNDSLSFRENQPSLPAEQSCTLRPKACQKAMIRSKKGADRYLFLRCAGDQNIGQNAQHQCAGNGGQGDLSEGDSQAAHTGDEDHGDHK